MRGSFLRPYVSLNFTLEEVIKKLQEKELLEAAEQQSALRLTFLLRLTANTEVSWETVLWQHRLYIQVPSYLLPEGSKEG
jgi:hypothetical protein